MLKPVALILAALAASALACGPTQGLADRAREAIPTKDTVAIGKPEGSAGALRLPPGGETAAQVGESSQWALHTAVLATQINGSVVWILSLVEGITKLPPTSCTETSCVWGPGSGALDPVSWKLVVTHDAAQDTYAWALSGERKAEAGTGFVAIVEGAAKPSALPHRGAGSFTVDFDAGRTLNSLSQDLGKLSVEYSNATPGQAKVDALFLGVKDNDHAGQKLNAAYSFAEAGGAGGDLDVAWHNTTSNNRLSLHSRWKGTGAGRADLSLSIAGGTGAYQASASECWRAADFKVSYFHTDDPAHLGPDGGVETDCAFSPAAPGTRTAP